MPLKNTQQILDRKIFYALLKDLKKRYKVSVPQILEIIEFCFHGDLIPPIKQLFRKNKQFNKYVNGVLNINSNELRRAFERTVPKLKELRSLTKLRRPQMRYEVRDEMVFKNKQGVYQQFNFNDEGDEDEQSPYESSGLGQE